MLIKKPNLQLVMFVEDLNMPLPEKYGAQPSLEFLRQFIGNDGFYDINRYNWKAQGKTTTQAHEVSRTGLF